MRMGSTRRCAVARACTTRGTSRRCASFIRIAGGKNYTTTRMNKTPSHSRAAIVLAMMVLKMNSLLSLLLKPAYFFYTTSPVSFVAVHAAHWNPNEIPPEMFMSAMDFDPAATTPASSSTSPFDGERKNFRAEHQAAPGAVKKPTASPSAGAKAGGTRKLGKETKEKSSCSDEGARKNNTMTISESEQSVEGGTSMDVDNMAREGRDVASGGSTTRNAAEEVVPMIQEQGGQHHHQQEAAGSAPGASGMDSSWIFKNTSALFQEAQQAAYYLARSTAMEAAQLRDQMSPGKMMMENYMMKTKALLVPSSPSKLKNPMERLKSAGTSMMPKITDFDFSHFGGGGTGGTTSSTVPASGTATAGEQERHGADTNASKGTSTFRKNKKERKTGTNLHDGSRASASTSINSAGILKTKKDNRTNLPTADASGTSTGSSWTSAMFAESQNPPQVAPAVEVVGEAVAQLGAAPVSTSAHKKQSSKSSKHAKQKKKPKNFLEIEPSSFPPSPPDSDEISVVDAVDVAERGSSLAAMSSIGEEILGQIYDSMPDPSSITSPLEELGKRLSSLVLHDSFSTTSSGKRILEQNLDPFLLKTTVGGGAGEQRGDSDSKSGRRTTTTSTTKWDESISSSSTSLLNNGAENMSNTVIREDYFSSGAGAPPARSQALTTVAEDELQDESCCGSSPSSISKSSSTSRDTKNKPSSPLQSNDKHVSPPLSETDGGKGVLAVESIQALPLVLEEPAKKYDSQAGEQQDEVQLRDHEKDTTHHSTSAQGHQQNYTGKKSCCNAASVVERQPSPHRIMLSTGEKGREQTSPVGVGAAGGQLGRDDSRGTELELNPKPNSPPEVQEKIKGGTRIFTAEMDVDEDEDKEDFHDSNEVEQTSDSGGAAPGEINDASASNSKRHVHDVDNNESDSEFHEALSNDEDFASSWCVLSDEDYGIPASSKDEENDSPASAGDEDHTTEKIQHQLRPDQDQDEIKNAVVLDGGPPAAMPDSIKPRKLQRATTISTRCDSSDTLPIPFSPAASEQPGSPRSSNANGDDYYANAEEDQDAHQNANSQLLLEGVDFDNSTEDNSQRRTSTRAALRRTTTSQETKKMELQLEALATAALAESEWVMPNPAVTDAAKGVTTMTFLRKVQLDLTGVNSVRSAEGQSLVTAKSWPPCEFGFDLARFSKQLKKLPEYGSEEEAEKVWKEDVKKELEKREKLAKSGGKSAEVGTKATTTATTKASTPLCLASDDAAKHLYFRFGLDTVSMSRANQYIDNLVLPPKVSFGPTHYRQTHVTLNQPATVQDTTKTEVSLDIFSAEDTPYLWTLQVTAEVMVQTGARFRVVAKLKEMIAKAVAHWGLPELNHELSPFREIAESLTLLFVKEVLV
ncbi:unnamed protein product [Amoebophrya sp. A120]|nr:unnamed protein product [Amoebophrya sp. A120]|eukprot:GSA120T00000068001.1